MKCGGPSSRRPGRPRRVQGSTRAHPSRPAAVEGAVGEPAKLAAALKSMRQEMVQHAVPLLDAHFVIIADELFEGGSPPSARHHRGQMNHSQRGRGAPPRRARPDLHPFFLKAAASCETTPSRSRSMCSGLRPSAFLVSAISVPAASTDFTLAPAGERHRHRRDPARRRAHHGAYRTCVRRGRGAWGQWCRGSWSLCLS